ncbi:hypothetical protein EfmAA818_10670 [Enterococcus faecium]|nr:hypothetical protein EfmAA818_10670 [Enterococcus faecium]
MTTQRMFITNYIIKKFYFKHAAQKEMLPLPKTSLQMMDADLNLITTPKLFLEEEQLPENYRIVGPIFAKLSTSLPYLTFFIVH